jgi:hypothetical protein
MRPCFFSDEIPGSFRHVMRPLVAGLTARGMHREWRAAMPKDLAQVDYVREFIDLLEKNAPTVKRPTLVRRVRPPFPNATADRRRVDRGGYEAPDL